MAVQALAGSVPVSRLALQNGVSRKFVYQQKNMVSAALDEVFASSAPDDEVLFELPVTCNGSRLKTGVLAFDAAFGSR